MNHAIWENHPETKMFVTEMDRGISFTLRQGVDWQECHLTYQQAGKLMEALADCLNGASFEGRWQIN